MAKRSGLTRGDRRRNDRIQALRAVVRADRGLLAIDLGEDKQVAALMDHDGRVLARRTVRVKASGLGGLLGWAAGLAVAHGFAGVVVGCEPTGHRWRTVMMLADDAGMGFVCVHSLRVSLAREEDDYTRDKTDHKDSVLIGKLIGRLDCYLPERASEDWAQLRHLGQQRARLVARSASLRQQIVDLLASCWPAALRCAARPFDSTTWLACLAVALEHCDGDPALVHRLGREAYFALVRSRLPQWGGRRVARRVANKFFDALLDGAGVAAQRRGGLERAGLLLDERRDALQRLQTQQQRMVGILDAMGLTALVTTIPGVTAIGAATILAETGDMSRFDSARSVVKHAGLNPTENTSATFRGRTRVSRRGRPLLRTAAWRITWGALSHNQILHDRFVHLTTRKRDPLAPGRARVACAATLLRWLYAVVIHRQAWNPDTAAGRNNPRIVTEATMAA